MGDKHAKYFDDNPRAATYVDTLLQQDLRYVAHEFLNAHWPSFCFADVSAAFQQSGLAFVGSLPVHTNFWALCVGSEFQELFRTTTDRLVTESHKEFCVDTTFRWDLYAKSPRLLGDLNARLREVDDIHYRAAHGASKLPYTANLGVVTSTVQGQVCQALLDLLASGSRRISEILAADSMKGVDRTDSARAADAGVATGLLEIGVGAVQGGAHAVPDAVEVPLPFNRAVLAAESLGGRVVSLASSLVGNGFQLGDLDVAILHELVEFGRDGLVPRVTQRLEASGRTLTRQGKVGEHATDRARLVVEVCATFLASVLPELVRLGIVTR